MLLDIVFSLDSVITAVGLAREIAIMIAAVVIAVLVMMVFAARISAFIERHPTLKMLALSFLLLIGVVLDRRRLRPARLEGLHLLRDGLLAVRRDPEHPAAPRDHEPPVELHQSYVQEG